jgi:hypothetical protein
MPPCLAKPAAGSRNRPKVSWNPTPTRPRIIFERRWSSTLKLVLFLSTGRCGTQFFTRYLASAGGSRAVVLHEPIRAGYAPKSALRAPDLNELLSKLPAVREHLDRIAEIVEGGTLYVETGWPVFPWIPLLLDRFGEDTLVVHLTRDPVRFAFSLASIRFYSPERRGGYVRLGRLEPTDPGVKHREYAAQWNSLNPVERALFQWLEINAWAEELKVRSPGHFLMLRSEDALARPGTLLEGMIERRPSLASVFCEPPVTPGVVDKQPSREEVDAQSLLCSADVPRLAEQYGYSPNGRAGARLQAGID